ncbi:MAG: hypothetical protein WBS19_08410 [Candidatus Korobacteraceae bacterium]
MTTRMLVMVSGAIEAATAVALIALPDVVARLLLGAELSGSGIAVARVAGFGLLALAIAVWPGGNRPSAHATRALFLYNLLAGLYLGFLRVGGEFTGFLLWPAAIVHVVLALLLARPAYDKASSANRAHPQ